jgi:8-oxo-dGTP diphosphatase
MLDATAKEKGIAVGIVQNAAGKVLIMQRVRTEKGSDGSILTWVFPGGKLDASEDFEQAVEREVLMEIGYKVKANKLISERLHPQFGVQIKYFLCELAALTTKPIQEVHEVASIKWVDPSELTDYFTTDIDPKVAKFLGL